MVELRNPFRYDRGEKILLEQPDQDSDIEVRTSLDKATIFAKIALARAQRATRNTDPGALVDITLPELMITPNPTDLRTDIAMLEDDSCRSPLFVEISGNIATVMCVSRQSSIAAIETVLANTG